MEITDIIGKGKTFEPPFSSDKAFIFDANRKLMAYIDYAAIEYLNYHTRLAIRATIARHICDLLNREHGEGGNQRYQLLSQCCDVVRNTNLSEGIKSNLINTFMRL